MQTKHWVVLLALVCAAGCDDILGPEAGDWRFSEGTDAVSGEPYAHASLQGSPLSAGVTLYVRCRLGRFDVYVSTDFVIGNGPVRFNIDGSGERSQTWGEGEGFRSLFYRGDRRAFARELASASEMVMQIREYPNSARTVTFHLRGLDTHLPKIEAACS